MFLLLVRILFYIIYLNEILLLHTICLFNTLMFDYFNIHLQQNRIEFKDMYYYQKILEHSQGIQSKISFLEK